MLTLQQLADSVMLPPYLTQVLITVLVVSVACLFIFRLSKQLSMRDLFVFDFQKHTQKALLHPTLQKSIAIGLYIIKYLILYPLYILMWGAIFIVLLLLLANTNDYFFIVFAATVIIAVIRVLAYFNEHASEALSQALPLVLLVTVVLDPSTILNISLPEEFLLDYSLLFMSIGFLVVEEWILRAAQFVSYRVFEKPRQMQDEKDLQKIMSP